MSENVEGEKFETYIEVPDPNTVEMVNTLSRIIDGVMRSLPFDFSCGDLICATIAVAVGSAKQASMDPAKIRASVLTAVDSIMEQDAARSGSGRVH